MNGKSKYITINFHIHTTYSNDGYNSFPRLYSCARRNRIDVLAITDHDTIEGAVKFKNWLVNNNKSDLQIIVGEEVTCSDGTHIIGLFLKEKIKSKLPTEVVSEIKNQGAFVYFPHPARHDGILDSEYLEETAKSGDFYEYFNAKFSDEYNEKAFNHLNHLMSPLGGSDAHYNADIGKCICTLPAASDLFETLRDYRSNRKIKIEGHRKSPNSSINYFPLYYKYKEQLNLPMFIRNFAKKIFPFLKNLRERNFKPTLTTIYENL
jgi:predicted metal-dependent phosphoesterase TrpH